MNAVEVTLNPDLNETEVFEINETNIAFFQVVDAAGKRIEGARIDLQISIDGLLGLGIELIRLSKGQDRIRHLRPSSSDCAVSNTGVYLHPKSAELLILKQELGSIEALLNE